MFVVMIIMLIALIIFAPEFGAYIGHRIAGSQGA